MAAEKKDVLALVSDSLSPVLIGELRGCVLEQGSWVDETGKRKEFQSVKIALEVGTYPHVKSFTVSVGERGVEAETATRIQKIPRGSIVGCPILGWVRQKGAVTGTASDVVVL